MPWPSRVPLLVCTLLLSAHVAAQRLPPGRDVISAPAVGAGLCVHNVFQSNMVLQRSKPARIWGWADPGERVTVTFAGQTVGEVADAQRAWSVTLAPMTASSEERSLIISAPSGTLTLTNVLVGDVWILGGQSNMEFPLDRVEHGDLEIVSANYRGVRLLTLPNQMGPEAKVGFPRVDEWSDWLGQHVRKGDWDVCSPAVAREASAIGMVFARRIHLASQIPIGVIDASVGGTTVETWTRLATLESVGTPEVAALLEDWNRKIAEYDPDADLTRRVQQYEQRVQRAKERGEKPPPTRDLPTDVRPGPAWDPNRPGSRHANVLAPLTGLAVRGALFHQGYNNALGAGAAGAAMYSQVFPRMIADWRKTFDDPALPFGILSLCTDGEPQTLDNYLEMMVNEGIFIREVHYKTFLDLRAAGDLDIGFASTFDFRRAWYHPQEKVPAGERIARWALATQYGCERDIRWLPPRLEKMQVVGDTIELHLDSPVRIVEGGPPLGFAIAGDDRRFQPADARWLQSGVQDNGQPRLDPRVLVLTSRHVPRPKHFRYAWGRNPLGNVKSADDALIPFATQRSDDWTIDDVPMPVDGKIRSQNESRRLLRAQDLTRRVRDAQAFLDSQPK